MSTELDTATVATLGGPDALMAARDEARKSGDYARADALRDMMHRAGYIVEDLGWGSIYRQRNPE